MHNDRFDDFARVFSTRISRRGLASIAAAALTTISGQTTEAGAGDRQGGARNRSRKRRRGASEGQDDAASAQQPVESSAKKSKGKSRRKKCVNAGGSCKKPKKGRAKKCCAGLNCDAATQTCVTPGGNGGGVTADACPPELYTCDGGCVPDGTPCCPPGQRPCDYACVSGNQFCETEFARCIAPFFAEWQAAAHACTGACEDQESAACQECAAGVRDAIGEPFSDCALRTGADLGALSEVAARGESSTPCNPGELQICRINAFGQNAWGAGWGMLAALTGGQGLVALLAAAEPALANGGNFINDLWNCEKEYGCKDGGQCSRVFGICCGRSGMCETFNASGRCRFMCVADEYCDPVLSRCVTRCKQCHEYLVDGRHMPCGQIKNNCGQTLTCNGCAATERCENRRCVPKCGPGRALADGDECCLPESREETCGARTCGTATNNCGESVDCGSCPDGASCEGGTCVCGETPAEACARSGATCGPVFDACWYEVQCGTCPPEQFCYTHRHNLSNLVVQAECVDRGWYALEHPLPTAQAWVNDTISVYVNGALVFEKTYGADSYVYDNAFMAKAGDEIRIVASDRIDGCSGSLSRLAVHGGFTGRKFERLIVHDVNENALPCGVDGAFWEYTFTLE